MGMFCYSNVINTICIIYSVMFRCFSSIIGVPLYNVVFPKHTKECLAKVIFEQTTQKFRETLVEKVLQRRLDTNIVYKDSSSFDSSPIATEHSPKTNAWQARSNCKVLIKIWTLIYLKNVMSLMYNYYYFSCCFIVSHFFLLR